MDTEFSFNQEMERKAEKEKQIISIVTMLKFYSKLLFKNNIYIDFFLHFIVLV